MRAYITVLTLVIVLLVGSLVFAQEGGAHALKKNHSVYAELEKAPEKARAKSNPLERDPDAIAAGKNLFAEHCAECHGGTAEGGKKAPSLRAVEVQNATPGALFWIVTNGVVRRGMPTWSKLPEPQRWQLVSYLKSLGVSPLNAAPTAPQPAQATAPPSPRR